MIPPTTSRRQANDRETSVTLAKDPRPYLPDRETSVTLAKDPRPYLPEVRGRFRQVPRCAFEGVAHLLGGLTVPGPDGPARVGPVSSAIQRGGLTGRCTDREGLAAGCL
ncbi:hypothetical protein Skr01_03590 [Sphaerisporangium krabiense]|nr:hypothetical protein Skr01_03590 [Sphaerisporangium krabiense]